MLDGKGLRVATHARWTLVVYHIFVLRKVGSLATSRMGLRDPRTALESVSLRRMSFEVLLEKRPLKELGLQV